MHENFFSIIGMSNFNLGIKLVFNEIDKISNMSTKFTFILHQVKPSVVYGDDEKKNYVHACKGWSMISICLCEEEKRGVRFENN